MAAAASVRDSAMWPPWIGHASTTTRTPTCSGSALLRLLQPRLLFPLHSPLLRPRPWLLAPAPALVPAPASASALPLLWRFAFDLASRSASRAPQSGAAEEAPMSERSEFGRRAASGEARRGPARLYRAGSRPARGLFGSFLVHQKGTRTRSGRKPCT